MKDTVLLLALENINNVGEELLRETTEHLICQTTNNVDIKIAQFKPFETPILKRHKQIQRLCYYIRRSSRLFKGNNAYRILNVSYKIKYTQYFEDLIKHADKVITAVGMFKYSTQDFSYIYYIIAKACEKYHKPLMISAPSIEAYNPNDWRSKQLIKAANFPSVKMITTRDGAAGVNTLKNSYLVGNRFIIDDVADPALWIPECYNIKRNHTVNPIPYIGINVIRKGIFDDYNKSFTDEQLTQIYIELIKQIEMKGWKWALYSNGMPQDIAVINELHSTLNLSEDHILKQPKNAKEFVEMIGNFDAVFGARLHTCITSVALGVPVVGFIWDNKIRYFAETMKIQPFFLEPKNMTTKSIIQMLELAIKSKYDFKNVVYLKNKTLLSIRQFLEIKE